MQSWALIAVLRQEVQPEVRLPVLVQVRGAVGILQTWRLRDRRAETSAGQERLGGSILLCPCCSVPA